MLNNWDGLTYSCILFRILVLFTLTFSNEINKKNIQLLHDISIYSCFVSALFSTMNIPWGQHLFIVLQLQRKWSWMKISVIQSLSRKLSSAGMTGLIPFRCRMSATTDAARDVWSRGSPGKSCQWSNTHCGKAWPPVCPLNSSAKPMVKRYFVS